MILMNAILVATDFGETSDAALVYGRNLARTFGARLYVRLRRHSRVSARGLRRPRPGRQNRTHVAPRWYRRR